MHARHLTLPLLLLSLAAQAQPVSLRSQDSSELGIEIMSLRYEAGSGSERFTEQGNKIGLMGRFTQALPDQWFWGAEARQSHGNINYSSASRGIKGGNADVVTEARITGGRDYPLGRQLLAPYFGIGYRKLSTDLRGLTSTGDEGYRRRSQYVYLPLGLTHRLQLGPEARLSTSVEYDLLLEGRQQSFLSDTDASSDDPVNSQRKGHGLRLTSSYEAYHWSIGFFVHYWRVGASDEARQSLGGVPAAVIVEPRNTTREAGVQFRLRFH
ncbi:MAG: hypothetical protein ACK4F4_09005 [Hylemonella sp.]|jgi:hypothetical protein|uniref:hypothetical protein n=1 Tax=Hylemonella sp. TaxID=2066020 RepID=UPI00391A8D05